MRVTISGKGVLQGHTILDPASKIPRCHRFSRVPYALPPVGKRRWRKPEPLPADFSYGSFHKPGRFIRPSLPCPQQPRYGLQSSGEDCLHLNIWVPLGKSPDGGWPVFFYIHGGFLQFGSNNSDDPSALLSETGLKCIIVSPGYRLGIFGFLASLELWNNTSAANLGFWDQRLALEWSYKNIESFGGNKNNITVGGLSAGSYSTFHQLAYDIGPTSNQQIIRRVFQWSNGYGVQLKRLSEAQGQFDDLISVLGIPSSLSADQKLDVLRGKTAEELLEAVSRMERQFLRPILDGNFISEELFGNIFNGNFGRRMKDFGIQTMIGDLTQEHHLYKGVFPPTSYEGLIERLNWDYPRDVAAAVSAPYKPRHSGEKKSSEEWMEIFGKLYADLQIHSTMRGFLDSISSTLLISNICRYRIDWRTKSVDKRLPPEVGATHGTDMSIWFFGNGDTLTGSEKTLIKEWLRPVASFLKGEDFIWGTNSLREVRYLTAEGKIEIKDDEVWDEKLPLWEVTKNVSLMQLRSKI